MRLHAEFFPQNRMKSLPPEKQALAAANVNLIHGYLRKYPPPDIRGMDYDDWYGVVAEGYMVAVRLYDTTKGAFATLAYTAMRSYVRRKITHEKRLMRKVPCGTVSLDMPTTESGDCSLGDMIPSGENLAEDYEERAEQQERLELLRSALDSLDDTLRRVVEMRMQGMAQREIGKEMGLSHTRIGQLEAKAIRKMKGFIEMEKTEGKTLKPKHAEILELYAQGLKQADIVRKLGIPPATVSWAIKNHAPAKAEAEAKPAPLKPNTDLNELCKETYHCEDKPAAAPIPQAVLGALDDVLAVKARELEKRRQYAESMQREAAAAREEYEYLCAEFEAIAGFVAYKNINV